MKQYFIALKALRDIERILEISPDNVDRVDYYRAGRRIRSIVSSAFRHIFILNEEIRDSAVHSNSDEKGFDYDEWYRWYEEWCREHGEEIENEWMEYYRRS